MIMWQPKNVVLWGPPVAVAAFFATQFLAEAGLITPSGLLKFSCGFLFGSWVIHALARLFQYLNGGAPEGPLKVIERVPWMKRFHYRLWNDSRNTGEHTDDRSLMVLVGLTLDQMGLSDQVFDRVKKILADRDHARKLVSADLISTLDADPTAQKN